MQWCAATPVDFSSLRFVPLAVDSSVESHAAWSPDGKSVAYMRYSPGKGTQIVVRALDSLAASVIAQEDTGALADLAWAPDGSRLFYVNLHPTGGLKSVSAIGGAPRLEVPGARAAHVSPDGRLIAVWKVTKRENQLESALWIGPLGGSLARYERRR